MTKITLKSAGLALLAAGALAAPALAQTAEPDVTPPNGEIGTPELLSIGSSDAEN